MKQTLTFSLLALMFVMLAAPAVSSAHQIDVFRGGYWGGSPDSILSCSIFDPANSGKKAVEICTLCDVFHTAQHIIYFGLTVLLYIITPLLIMWAGVLMLVSQGSTEMVGQAHKIFTGTAIGVLIGIVAWIIVNTFFVTLAGITGAQNISWSNINCDSIPSSLQ